MKNLAAIILIAPILFLLSVVMINAATVEISVEATILPSTSITTVSGLSFGAISVDTGEGSVAVGADGKIETDGGVTLRDSSASSPAKLVINGPTGADFSISLPASVVLLDENGNTMNVDSFSSSAGLSGKLDENGNLEIGVGATLRIKSSQLPGTYRGNMLVDVNY